MRCRTGRRDLPGRALGLLLAGVLIAGAAALQPAPDPDHVGLGGAGIAVNPTRPASWQARERRWAGRAPLYLVFRLGDAGTVTHAVVDASSGGDSGYDTIYVDADGDGDLADELPLRPTRDDAGRTLSLRTAVIRADVQYADGTRRELGIRIAVSGVRDPTTDGMAWTAQCRVAESMAGTVVIGDSAPRRIAILDRETDTREMNGCFNDYGVDRLRIDLNRDGTLDPETEDVPLSRVIAVDGALWAFGVDAAAMQVSARPYVLPTGRLRLSAGTTAAQPVRGQVELLSEETGCAFACRLPGDAGLAIPAGSYRVARGRMEVENVEGRTWVATLRLTNAVEVAAGAEARLALGQPFRVVPVSEGELKRGSSACMTAHVFGAAGEEYTNIAPRRMRMKPRVRIEDAVEITVAEGQMEYG